jgi:fimbrial chaperone protein
MGRFPLIGCAGIRLSSAIARLLSLSLALAGPVSAQSLSIAPVTLNMVPGQRATSLTITNAGSVETAVQIRPFVWEQNPQDSLTPASDVVVSPPIVKIPANGSQVVRILVRHATSDRELSYRLLIDQLPRSTTPGTVQFALRISLPVFVEPATTATAKLQARIAVDAGRQVLILENNGGRHEKLRQIALHRESGLPLGVDGGAQLYLLAGATRSFPLAGEPLQSRTTRPYRVTAQSIDGPIDLAVANSEAR